MQPEENISNFHHVAAVSGREADSVSLSRMRISGRTIRKHLSSAARSYLRFLAVAAVVFAFSLPTFARRIQVCDSAAIHFPQSHSGLSLSISDNKAELDRITDFMRRYNNPDSGYMLRSVRVIGGASPEGSVAINEALSRRRAATIFDYILQRETVPDSLATFIFLGRDWKGLRSLVADDAQVPYRADVLKVIDETLTDGPETPEVSNRGLSRLRALHRGVPYQYLYARQFPQLRASRLFVEYEAPSVADAIPQPVSELDTISLNLVGQEIVAEDTTAFLLGKVDCCKPFYMSLKTNMLYDALALPSVGAEFYVGKNWSVGVNWTYGWWSKNDRHRYWRAYGGDLNLRRWFGRKAQEKPLTGHHLGIYAGVVTYDFELGGKGYMGGLPHRTLWDRCNYTAGVEYGYSLPIARRLNIDFTLGIGYLGGKYLEYVPKGKGYQWQKTMRLNWFGPTKAEISLVWLIGCGNSNSSKKGGNL